MRGQGKLPALQHSTTRRIQCPHRHAPPTWPPLAGERHDPVRLPGFASVGGERLLEVGRI